MRCDKKRGEEKQGGKKENRKNRKKKKEKTDFPGVFQISISFLNVVLRNRVTEQQLMNGQRGVE